MPTETSVVLLGPPGAGKTTIGKLAAVILNMRFMDLDDFVRPVYDPVAKKRPMTDSEVDEVLKNLLNACRPGDLIEFSHHDYPIALSMYKEQFHEKPRTALMIADPNVCYERNGQRKSPVPRHYVSRCIQSSQQLHSEMESQSSILVCVLETDRYSIDDCVDRLVNFIKRTH